MQGHTAKWLAEQLHCERTNVYDIFKRDDMNAELIGKISVILGHDFFEDLSRDFFPGKYENSK